MDGKQQTQNSPEPKPLAFTIDFTGNKPIDTQRHKLLVEKYQKRHRRGKSLSKLEESPPPNQPTKKAPLTGNLPRKSSLQSSEGYFSSDEKNGRPLSGKSKADLCLPIRSMSASYPSGNLPIISSPEVELKDVSSPELDSMSPSSGDLEANATIQKYSSPEEAEVFVDGTDFDKSDSVSDAGTYTVDAENPTTARTSIDREFQIEEVSVLQKTQEYVLSLNGSKRTPAASRLNSTLTSEPKSPLLSPLNVGSFQFKQKPLSPILSPTQNLSITNNLDDEGDANKTEDLHNMTFTKIMFPSPKAKTGIGLGQSQDQGSVISVTSSGAFRVNMEKERKRLRSLCLSKSEVHVEAYTGDLAPKVACNLTTNLVNVQSICTTTTKSDLVLDKVSNLPPSGVSGKTSPSKIPSPVHNSSRPRSRNSISSANVDLSDSSLETESYLWPTQNYIFALERKLPSSDQELDYNNKYKHLNNDTTNLLKQKLTHVRHNSFDDRNLKVQNKLEHFQTKNLQSIDQTPKILNQYSDKIIRKIQNSPNNSPIRRSSSFSTKNQTLLKNTNLNLQQKPSNIPNSPSLTRNGSIQRSASTANIKPKQCTYKIDRNQFADTESSSDDDYDQRKTTPNITSTKYNRAFALRRARLDEPSPPKCPNTPEMRRKFQPEHVRAFSMDRKPNDVQSRYLQNLTKKSAAVVPKEEKGTPKGAVKAVGSKPQVFARTDSGRFSMRAAVSPKVGASVQKGARKDTTGKKSNGRSNSSLSCKEVEFQNWKRRKSYDPMKAAAEGKRKMEMARKQNVMVQSCSDANQNQDCDSSPSHSSSVHRSQSFHGTAALERLASSDEDEDCTLSADEGFSPPTPSPRELSPARAGVRHAWKDHRLPY